MAVLKFVSFLALVTLAASKPHDVSSIFGGGMDAATGMAGGAGNAGASGGVDAALAGWSKATGAAKEVSNVGAGAASDKANAGFQGVGHFADLAKGAKETAGNVAGAFFNAGIQTSLGFAEEASGIASKGASTGLNIGLTAAKKFGAAADFPSSIAGKASGAAEKASDVAAGFSGVGSAGLNAGIGLEGKFSGMAKGVTNAGSDC